MYRRQKQQEERAEAGLPPADEVDRSGIEQSHVKIIKCGHHIETYEYQRPVTLGRKTGGRRADGGISERMMQNRNLTLRRAQAKIRRLINCNFTENSKFITLTFRDTETVQADREGSASAQPPDLQPAAKDQKPKGTKRWNRSPFSGDIRKVKETNAEFKRFIQRLRRHMDDEGYDSAFPYIGVIEFQDENGRGAVHYHLVMHVPYIPNEVLAAIWGNGFVRINRIDNCDNVGRYITAYMTADMTDERLLGHKAYLVSKGLRQPEEIKGETAHVEIQRIEREEKKNRVAERSYPSEYLGHIEYREYNTKQTLKGIRRRQEAAAKSNSGK